MPLFLSKKPEETWKEAAIRYAAKYGMETEIENFYDDLIKKGAPEDKAAFWTLDEWDLLDYEDE